ncbi:MAG: DNA starvation/stationary phase protection protein Dps, partial [Chloroflexota bacterium]
RHPLDAEERVEMVTVLNQQLADLSDLYSQTKQAHWNVRGIHFAQFHELFDEVAASIHPYIDELAERVNTLGGYAYGTVSMVAIASRLDDFPTDVVEGIAMLDVVIDRWASYSEMLRDAIEVADDVDDDLTEDLLIEVGRVVDKGLWFLEAHVQS